MKDHLTVREFISAFDSGYSLVKQLQDDINALNVYLCQTVIRDQHVLDFGKCRK